jgi:hypothetical protein
MTRPDPSEYSGFNAAYVDLVPESDVMPILEAQQAEVGSLVRRVPSGRETSAYGPGKWTIRQVVGHMTDAERVFGYRAFCIARGEVASLPSFDETTYANRSDAASRPLAELVDDFVAVRDVNLRVLRRLHGDAWRAMGTVNDRPASVRGLAFIMAGHVRHHLRLLAERYGVLARP